MLASTSILLLTLVYIGVLLVKTFEDFSATDYHLTQRVLGFSSTDSIVAVMLAFTVVMLFVLAATAVHTLRSEERMAILLSMENRLPPKLSLARGHRWMLFNSHVWSTGQDQARSSVCSCPYSCPHVVGSMLVSAACDSLLLFPYHCIVLSHLTRRRRLSGSSSGCYLVARYSSMSTTCSTSATLRPISTRAVASFCFSPKVISAPETASAR